jgi:hypothetical protein
MKSSWCDITVLNFNTPAEDKVDDMKESFCKELEHAFDKFPKYHMKILLGYFNANVGREDIFKPRIGNESLHKIRNDNGVRVVNLATMKNVIFKSTVFPHRNIHKFTWTSPDGKTHSQIDRILIGVSIQVFLMSDDSGEQTVILTSIWLWQKLEGLAASKQTMHKLYVEMFSLKK